MRGRGRPKVENVNLDVEILDEARSACNHISLISHGISMNCLSSTE